MKKRVLIFFIAVCLVLSVFTVISCKDKKQNIICDDATFEYDGAGKRIFAVNDINKDFSYRYVGDGFDYYSERPPAEPGKYKVIITKEGYNDKTVYLTITTPLLTDKNANIVGISQEKSEVLVPESINGASVKEIISLKSQRIERLVLSKSITSVDGLELKDGAVVKLSNTSVKFDSDQNLSRYLIELSGGEIDENFFANNETIERIKLTDKTAGLKNALAKSGISDLILSGATYLDEDVSALVEQITLDNVSSLRNTVVIPQTVLKTLEIKSDYFIDYQESDFGCFENADTIVLGKNVCINDSVNSDCLSGKTLTFKDGVTVLEDADFSFVEFGKIIIPDCVTDISGALFKDNSMLTEVVLGKGVAVLPDNIFNNCEALSKINLENVKAIGDYSFQNTLSLSEVEFSDKLEEIGEFVFASAALKNVSLAACENLTEIPQGAFYGCKDLTEIASGDNIKYIGDNAFASTELESFQMPQKTESLGKYVFSNSKLKTFKANALLKEIPEGCFSVCERLTEVVLNEGLEKISAYSFSMCYSLESLEIPSTVTQIVKAQIDNGTKLILKGNNFKKEGNYTLTADGERVVHYYGNENELVLPDSVKYVDDYALGSVLYRKITLSRGLLELETSAMQFHHIVVPDGMETLPNIKPAKCEILEFAGETPPVCNKEILVSSDKILIPYHSEQAYKDYFAQFLTSEQMDKVKVY